ncbi:MAG: GFA family protein [Jannaschia sp.]
MTDLTGRCLCGACTFTARPGGPLGAGACHCGMCRKWSGGMFLSVDCGETVRFAEDAPTASYKGSQWGERIFCSQCGSSLLWQAQEGTHQHVSIHCFDDPEQFEIAVEVFHDRKPANYALAGERRTMTEAEVFAMFAPEGEAQ